MKKLLLTATLLMTLPLLIIAQQKVSSDQTFVLTPSGFVNSSDSTKNFIVLEVPGVSQSDLYKKSLIYISGLYVSPKEVLSTIDNESITANGIEKNAIKIKVLFMNTSWTVNYTMAYQFKDGKVRVAAPSINKIETVTGDVYRTATINPASGANNKEIFNRKGQLKEKEGKQSLEALVNKYLSQYIIALNSTKQDNW